jgi:ParB-like chromosome segregation protein Spo0J
MTPKSYSPKQDKIAQLTTTRVALADLKPHPKNPRIHPKPGTPEWNALLKSLQNDYFDPLVVNSGRKDKSLRNVLVSGHLRLKVLLSDGFTHADVVYRDYTADEHIARMLAANKQQGDDDDARLIALLKNLDAQTAGLDRTGFTQAEIDSLLEIIEGKSCELIKLDLEPPPPKMSWVLIGIPTVNFGKISQHLERIADIPGVICESTANNG